jgi:hypothetical protein
MRSLGAIEYEKYYFFKYRRYSLHPEYHTMNSVTFYPIDKSVAYYPVSNIYDMKSLIDSWDLTRIGWDDVPSEVLRCLLVNGFGG